MVVELAPLFENSSPDNFCKIVNYTLKKINQSITPIDAALNGLIWLNGTHLFVNEFTPTITFAVMAETFNG